MLLIVVGYQMAQALGLNTEAFNAKLIRRSAVGLFGEARDYGDRIMRTLKASVCERCTPKDSAESLCPERAGTRSDHETQVRPLARHRRQRV